MAEIRYVEMTLKSDLLGRRASLRDYSIDLTTGKCSVNESKKIGRLAGKNDKIRVIYPAQMSEDGKWVRAMNADGTCGYIRASRVDLSQAKFNETKAEALKAPYQTFLTQNHRILYESENNIRTYSKEQIVEAKEGVTKYNQEIDLAQKLVKDYNDYVDIYNTAHPDAPKPMADPQGGNPQIDGVMQMAAAQNLKGARNAYNTYRIFLETQNDLKTLQSQNFVGEIDLKSGKIQTDISRREARDMVRTLYSMDTCTYKDPNDLPSFYSSCRNASEDLNTFYYGNRFFAEQAALERMEYKQKANETVIQKGFGMKGDLANPFSQINFERETKEAGFIANQVKANGGLLVCDNHSTTAAKDWITENMAAMKQSGVGVIYIEHLFEGKQQQIVDQFLKSDKNSPMSPALKQFCKADPSRAGFEALFEMARANDMRIIGIGSFLSQSNTSIDPYERISTFNSRAYEIVEYDLVSQFQVPNNGYVLLAGKAHMLFHEGMDKNMPLKGLSQMLGTRAIEIENKDGKLTPKPVDTAAVYVPAKNGKSSEVVKIDDYKKSLEAKAPEAKAPEAKAPEDKAPEDKAPEDKAPEAKAPEAKAPEAKAPEAKAPEAKAPEAKAPEAKAPEDKAPEAKAPEAKAPEAKAPEAKAPEANKIGRREVSMKALENAEKPAPKPERREWSKGIVPSGPRPQSLSQKGPHK